MDKTDGVTYGTEHGEAQGEKRASGGTRAIRVPQAARIITAGIRKQVQAIARHAQELGTGRDAPGQIYRGFNFVVARGKKQKVKIRRESAC